MSGSHHDEPTTDTPPDGVKIMLPTRFSREFMTVGLAGLLTLGGGGGVFASHSSLSAKVDSVLAGQQKLERDFAELRGAGTDARVREQEARLRVVEEKLARIEGGERGR